MRKNFLIFNLSAGTYLETLLISSVFTILIIRFYLHLSNYPQVGGGGLHIAHMLWGGLLMLVSIITLLSFLNKWVQFFSSAVAGIGFGLFIDELGKFITSDNNYFFEPTIAIIYVVFVIIFLLLRFIRSHQTVSKEEYLDNALEIIRFVVLDQSDSNLRGEAMNLLKKCDQNDPTVKNLYSLLNGIKANEKKENILFKFRNYFKSFIRFLISHKWFSYGVLSFFVAFSLFNLYRSSDVLGLYFKLNEFSLSYIELGQFISSIVAALLVIVGVLRFRFSKIGGLNLFKFSLLISILLTQFFDFYNNQFEALFVFVFNIAVLFILSFIIEEEKIKQA